MCRRRGKRRGNYELREVSGEQTGHSRSPSRRRLVRRGSLAQREAAHETFEPRAGAHRRARAEAAAWQRPARRVREVVVRDEIRGVGQVGDGCGVEDNFWAPPRRARRSSRRRSLWRSSWAAAAGCAGDAELLLEAEDVFLEAAHAVRGRALRACARRSRSRAYQYTITQQMDNVAVSYCRDGLCRSGLWARWLLTHSQCTRTVI